MTAEDEALLESIASAVKALDEKFMQINEKYKIVTGVKLDKSYEELSSFMNNSCRACLFLKLIQAIPGRGCKEIQ